jgi:hypothetical protein
LDGASQIIIISLIYIGSLKLSKETENLRKYAL